MILSNLFPTEKNKNEAIARMRSLKENPNWRFLVERIINPDIEDVSRRILDGDFKDIEEEKTLRKERAYWIILTKTPEKVIETLKSEKKETENFDPFYKNVKEFRKSSNE